MTIAKTNSANEARYKYDAETRAKALRLVLKEGVSRVEASRILNVPNMTLVQWVRKEEAKLGTVGRSRATVQDSPASQFLIDARARIQERDERMRLRPRFNFGMDLLGDPPPGRSALDVKLGFGNRITLDDVPESIEED